MLWLSKPPLGTPIDRSHRQMQGLVGWWLFQEGAGGMVNDLSGNGNIGTLNNFAFPPTPSSGWNPGRIGRTLAYDGTNDYIALGTASSFGIPTGGDSKAFSFWFRTTGAGSGATQHMILSYGVALQNSSWRISINAGLLGIFSNGGDSVSTSNTYNDGEWHHAVAMLDGNTLSLTVDGGDEVVSADGTNINTADTVIEIGQDVVAGSRWFDGLIDDVRIYNRALTQPEIQDIRHLPFAAFMTMDIAMLRVAQLMAMERSLNRRVFGRIFGRVN